MKDFIKSLLLGLPFLIYGLWDIRREYKKNFQKRHFRKNIDNFIIQFFLFILSTTFSWFAVLIGLILLLFGILSL